MRSLPAALRAISVVLASGLTGCAAGGGSADIANATCPDLNVSIGETSKELSAAAITRGKIGQFSVPFWLPGGRKAVSALEDRQTRKIEGLETELETARSARRARCR